MRHVEASGLALEDVGKVNAASFAFRCDLCSFHYYPVALVRQRIPAGQAACRGCDSQCSDSRNLLQEEFPLPLLGPLLELLHRDLLFGRGMRILRGLPTQHKHGLKCVRGTSTSRVLCPRASSSLKVSKPLTPGVHSHGTESPPAEKTVSKQNPTIQRRQNLALRRYVVTALWGVSVYFGPKVALTQAGHLVGHVRDAKSRIRVSGLWTKS